MDIDEQVWKNLQPIFPNLTENIIRASIRHPSNRASPCNADTLLQRCIDDLLELRTYESSTVTGDDPVIIDDLSASDSSSQPIEIGESSCPAPINTAVIVFDEDWEVAPKIKDKSDLPDILRSRRKGSLSIRSFFTSDSSKTNSSQQLPSAHAKKGKKKYESPFERAWSSPYTSTKDEVPDEPMDVDQFEESLLKHVNTNSKKRKVPSEPDFYDTTKVTIEEDEKTIVEGLFGLDKDGKGINSPADNQQATDNPKASHLFCQSDSNKSEEINNNAKIFDVDDKKYRSEDNTSSNPLDLTVPVPETVRDGVTVLKNDSFKPVQSAIVDRGDEKNEDELGFSFLSPGAGRLGPDLQATPPRHRVGGGLNVPTTGDGEPISKSTKTKSTQETISNVKSPETEVEKEPKTTKSKLSKVQELLAKTKALSKQVCKERDRMDKLVSEATSKNKARSITSHESPHKRPRYFLDADISGANSGTGGSGSLKADAKDTLVPAKSTAVAAALGRPPTTFSGSPPPRRAVPAGIPNPGPVVPDCLGGGDVPRAPIMGWPPFAESSASLSTTGAGIRWPAGQHNFLAGQQNPVVIRRPWEQQHVNAPQPPAENVETTSVDDNRNSAVPLKRPAPLPPPIPTAIGRLPKPMPPAPLPQQTAPRPSKQPDQAAAPPPVPAPRQPGPLEEGPEEVGRVDEQARPAVEIEASNESDDDERDLAAQEEEEFQRALALSLQETTPQQQQDVAAAEAAAIAAATLLPIEEVTVVKTAEDILQDDADIVFCLFPNIDRDFIVEKLRETSNHPDRRGLLCNHIIENPSDCPKVKKPEPPVPPVAVGGCTSSAAASSPEFQSIENYYEALEKNPSKAYRQHSFHLLTNEFKKISMRDLRYIHGIHNHRYALTRKCLLNAHKNAGINIHERPSASCEAGGDPEAGLVPGVFSPISASMPTIKCTWDLKNGKNGTLEMKMLKCGRPSRGLHGFKGLDPELKKELVFIRDFKKNQREKEDAAVASALNEKEYSEEGQGIECGCCFGDYAFEDMVQCYEGHLFCGECLKNYAKEAVFGQGKATLLCMTDGCDASYPKSQLVKSLPQEMLDKYEDRIQEEAINLADMADLVRCPHCDFAALMAPDDKVFRCQKCLKETCRHCREDWDEHFGIPCKELEKKDETKLRLAYEEKMTQAKVRTCHRCKASFTKSDGCNKMTCRCGAKMCYICRKPDIDYNHFCRHPRDPGHSCKTCKDCSLWTNPDEDDDRAVKELQKEGEEEKLKQGFSLDRQIGVVDKPNKKQKTH